jgi:hypothetical protein
MLDDFVRMIYEENIFEKIWGSWFLFTIMTMTWHSMICSSSTPIGKLIFPRIFSHVPGKYSSIKGQKDRLPGIKITSYKKLCPDYYKQMIGIGTDMILKEFKEVPSYRHEGTEETLFPS